MVVNRTRTVNMSDRDLKILMAMLSNLDSFLTDAEKKGGEKIAMVKISVEELAKPYHK